MIVPKRDSPSFDPLCRPCTQRGGPPSGRSAEHCSITEANRPPFDMKLCLQTHRKKLLVGTGLGKHCNRESCSMSIYSARPFKSEAGTLEVSYLAFTVILGVVYAGNNVIYKSEVFPPQTQIGERMVQSRSNFYDGGARPVLYLQVVFPVTDPIWHITEGNMHLGRTCGRTKILKIGIPLAGRSGQYNLRGYATIEDRAVTSYVHVHVLTSMCSHLIPSGCLCR